MKDYLVDVPVRINIWIRPECQRKQFEVIKKARPSILFLISDGGRNEKEWEAIYENRKIFETEIDWDCTIHKIYEEENQGLYAMGAKVANYIWERVDRCIFLEDDHIPSVSFFQYCADLLEKYFIVRIAWVFGLNGKNFIKTMLNVGKKYDTVRVVNNQIGTPTYTLDLSRLLVDMIETEKYGYYHATNEGGYISWYDFACEIFRQSGKTVTVHPVTTAEYGLSKAARPFNSRLDKSKLAENGFTPLPHWQDALSRYLKEIEE